MSDIRGIHVEAGGTYVMLEDVVATIREYAQSLDDANAGAAIHELASWLGAGSMPAATAGIEPVLENDPFDLDSVYRVELYPHPPEDPKPKWYARSVDVEGTILWTSEGDFDYEQAHRAATQRWPDKPIFQGHAWTYDSVFLEKMERNTNVTAAPLRERVSPKRMFA